MKFELFPERYPLEYALLCEIIGGELIEKETNSQRVAWGPGKPGKAWCRCQVLRYEDGWAFLHWQTWDTDGGVLHTSFDALIKHIRCALKEEAKFAGQSLRGVAD